MKLTAKEIETFKMSESDIAQFKKLVNGKGMTKAEALVAMGKAKVNKTVVTEAVKKEKAPRKPRPIDPVKNSVMGLIKGAIDGQNLTIISDSDKCIDFISNDEYYTITITKHKKKTV